MISTVAPFLPGAAQIVSLAGLVLVALGFVTIGAALGGRDRLPEADLLAGWAMVAGLFTVAGGVFDIPLTIVTGLSAVMAVGSAVVLWRRGEPVLERGSLVVLLWMAPLLLATASMQPSQWDEFSQWLPNARYLNLFDAFPGPGHPASDSVFPGYPPGVTVVFYLVGQLIGHFTDTVAPWFNLLLLAGSARLMIRLFRGPDDSETLGAGAAWGVLGVTVLATTFVPKLVLSSYADTATAVAVGFSAVLGLRLWEGGTKGGWGRAAQFALVFALLPMTKQGNFALMGLLVLALAWASWRGDGDWRRHWVLLGIALVPAVVATLAWRLHVSASGGDMSIRALSNWQWSLLPAILASMWHVAAAKGGYFGLGLVVLGLAVWRRPAGQPLVPLFALIFAGYNVFLLFVYLAILGGYESANAASFWRYNTHLGVLEMLVAAMLAGLIWRRLGSRRLGRAAVVFGGVAAVVGPFAAQKYIRFDRQPTKMDALVTITEMAKVIPGDAHLMVVDARGTGFFGHYANYHLGFGRHVIANFTAFDHTGIRGAIAGLQPDFIWVRTLTPAVTAELGLPLDETASHLLALEDGRLRLVKSWRYPAGLDPASDKD